MSNPATDYNLPELLICAASRAWDNDGEVLATGIGLVPRLAASLAMCTDQRSVVLEFANAHSGGRTA